MRTDSEIREIVKGIEEGKLNLEDYREDLTEYIVDYIDNPGEYCHPLIEAFFNLIALGILFIMFILAPLIVVWYITGSGLLGLITSFLFICYVGNPE